MAVNNSGGAYLVLLKQHQFCVIQTKFPPCLNQVVYALAPAQLADEDDAQRPRPSLAGARAEFVCVKPKVDTQNAVRRKS